MTKIKAKPNAKSKMNALFEIGLEEIPSRFMPAILADLKEKAKKELDEARLTYGSITTLGTPRRLVLSVEGLPVKQADIQKEVKGPSKDFAYKNGAPTKAIEGFASGQGVKVSDLTLKKLGDKEFVFADVNIKGIETEKLLKDLFPKIMKNMYMPISMRWADVDYKFIRPLHWFLAIAGNSVIDFEIAGIRSSNKTYGHRNTGSKPITIKTSSLDELKNALLKVNVLLDQDKRRALISNMVKDAAKKLGGQAVLYEDLLDEVNYLVEWPMVLTGTFKKDYLELPKDVLVTSMKKNQKYFAVTDASGKLLPAFINITNGIKPADSKNVIEGNEKVLIARLNDAKFFFGEDRKKTMSELVPSLSKVAFIEKLGSMLEKTDRIVALSGLIAHELNLPDQKKENIKSIAKLCKADLLTHMVYEFPSLQGVMGREYSLIEGKPKEVAQGIYEHYLPRFTGDEVPVSIEGAVVSIADKLDSIVGCFSIGLVPTGSEDPFALRRCAQGIVTILLSKKLNLSLDVIIEKAYKLYEPIFLGELFASGKIKYNDVQKVIPEALSFISARLKGNLIEEGIKYDIADAVITSFEDVLDVKQRADAVTKAYKMDWFKGIVFTGDRISRLATNATRGNIIESDLVSDEEKALNQLYLKVNDTVASCMQKGDYFSGIKALSDMTEAVEVFFNKVMVMDKDEKLKANRLALLKTIDRMYKGIADFSKIVM
jgi:glycyl-tRNA synthetase beta chain